MQCPHKCSKKDYAFHFNTIEQIGKIPQEGDCGVCYNCGGWWKLEDCEFIIYTPTDEEIHRALPLMEKSKQKFLIEHVKNCSICKKSRNENKN